MRDQGEGILNEIPLRFPHESKEFRRDPDLPRCGESKAQETTKKSRSKCQIAKRDFEERGGGGAERMSTVRAPPPPALYIGQLSRPDDPG